MRPGSRPVGLGVGRSGHDAPRAGPHPRRAGQGSLIYRLDDFFFLALMPDLRAAESETGGWAAPGAAPGKAGILPRPICFIIFSICLRASSSWLTCSTVLPEPLAILIRRLPSI